MARLDSILSGSLIFRDDGVEVSKLVPVGNEIQVTGSLNIKGPKLKLNGSDIEQRITTVENSVSVPALTIGGLTDFSSSVNDYTGSAKIQTANLEAVSASFNTFTGSTDTSITNLQSTASLTTQSLSLLDSRFTTIEGKTLVSSSTQISEIGFLSSSIQGIVSRSQQIIDLGFVTASRYDEILEIPSGIISSSAQIPTGNELSGSSIIGSDLLNIHNITGSVGITGSLSLDNSDLDVTGSFNLNLTGVTKYFQIDVDGREAVRVNNEGVFQLFSQSAAPNAVEGGLYYGDDYNLYLGVND